LEPSEKKKTSIVNLFLILWTILLAGAMLTPGSALPRLNSPYSDSVLHFTSFFILGILTSISLFEANRKRILIISILIILYSLLLEWIQSFIPSRTMEFRDVIMNLGGTLMGFLLLFITSIFNKKSR